MNLKPSIGGIFLSGFIAVIGLATPTFAATISIAAPRAEPPRCEAACPTVSHGYGNDPSSDAVRPAHHRVASRRPRTHVTYNRRRRHYSVLPIERQRGYVARGREYNFAPAVSTDGYAAAPTGHYTQPYSPNERRDQAWTPAGVSTAAQSTVVPTYNFYGPTTNYFGPIFNRSRVFEDGPAAQPSDGARMDPWHGYDPNNGLENGY